MFRDISRTVALWRQMASQNLVNIGSGNDLSTRQAIT